MTTALDLIKSALKDCGALGVGQTPLAEDANDALTRLNAMMSQWIRRRWLVYHLVDVVFQGTGQLFYTIGAGGDIDTVRPDRIEAAFFRQTVQAPGNNVDYPLIVLNAREEYNAIALKTMKSFPAYVFYDSAFPLGKVYVWPVPTNLYEMHLSVKAQLQQFASLTDEIILPPEYEECIRLNLALRLGVSYQLAPNNQLVALAKVSLNTIKNTNAQIPSLPMPADLVRGRLYDIFSDTTY